MKTKFLLLTISFIFSMWVMDSCKPKDKNTDPNATQFIDNHDGTVSIIDKGQGIGTRTLSADTTWILEGLVFVNDSQTLTIEAGTLIKGKPGTGENASALIVARGGKIEAVGTAEKPIVMTALADNYEGTGVDVKSTGLWGGLIILGRATTSDPTTEKAIEGIPTNETRGLYGGTNDNDNSGTLKYLSIRHGGTDIGEGNEINGLTLGAVGGQTVIDYIEVISNKDDGIEFFGGSPNVKHAFVAYCGDDSYDYDEGFHGKGQFWFTVHDQNSERCGEHDGGPSDNLLGTPYSNPTIYNATFIGSKETSSNLIIFRDNAGGTYANSIFVSKTKGITIEYLQDANSQMTGCSVKMWQDSLLKIKNNVFYDIADVTVDTGSFASKIFTFSLPKDANGNILYDAPDSLKQQFANYFTQASNIIANPGISAGNPVPANPQTSNMYAYPPNDNFFEHVSYKGAFQNENWATGWTLFYKNSK